MGSFASKKPIVDETRVKRQDMSEKDAYASQTNNDALTDHLRGLKLDDIDANRIDDINPISLDALGSWEQKFVSDDKNLLAQQAFGTTEIVKVVANKKSYKADQYLFNTTVDIIGADTFYNNQKSSGRCWIFATSNVLRSHVIRNYNLDTDKFQLSQTYFFFYDKLEKANLFLENVIATADLPVDDLYLMHIFKEPLSDGGQWDMIVNILNKYGAVPVEHFPDNAQAISTSKLNYIVFEKLREYGLILRELINTKTDAKSLKLVKHSMVKQIYDIISLALGTPPKPTAKITWEFIDKDKKYKYFETTPLNFYKDHVRFVANDHFSLINDPRNKFDSLYTVDKLNNVYGGKPIEYVNLDLPEIKQVAIKMLKANEPIFFGSDVGKFNDSKTGILDTGAYDYKLAFNTDFKISKAERLRTGSSQMTHAMVITGVHLDPNGVPLRWKIQNSWGEEVGDKGTFVMTDSWFDEYVFQIVTNKKFVSKKVYDIFKGKDYTVFPIYDPMGALA